MKVQIEVNTRCNFSCWFCQNAQYEVPSAKAMSLDNFETILIKLRQHFGVRLPLISFAAYNEPTLDIFFKDRLRMLTRMGYTYWWLSNGSLMSDELVEFLLAERPLITNFYFNLCASDPETLAQSVKISSVAAERYLNTLKKAFVRLPALDRRIFINVHGQGDQDHIDRVAKMKDWVRPHQVTVVKAPVMDRAGMLQGVGTPRNHRSDAWLVCGASNLANLYIGVEGDVYLCCHDYYQTTRYGNLLQQDVAQVLNTAERSAAMKYLKQSFCARCEFAIDAKRQPASAIRLATRNVVKALPKPVQAPLVSSFRRIRSLASLGAIGK